MEDLLSVSEELLSNLRIRYKSGGLALWFPFTTVPFQDVQKIVTEYVVIHAPYLLFELARHLILAVCFWA